MTVIKHTNKNGNIPGGPTASFDDSYPLILMMYV